VDGRIRSDNRKGNNNEAKWEAGKGLPTKVKQEWDKNTSVFLMLRMCDQRARGDKRLFGCSGFLILFVCLFCLFEPVSASTAVGKICKKADQILLSSLLLRLFLSTYGLICERFAFGEMACDVRETPNNESRELDAELSKLREPGKSQASRRSLQSELRLYGNNKNAQDSDGSLFLAVCRIKATQM
jgi:hypothetical protein